MVLKLRSPNYECTYNLQLWIKLVLFNLQPYFATAELYSSTPYIAKAITLIVNLGFAGWVGADIASGQKLWGFGPMFFNNPPVLSNFCWKQ